MHLPFAFDPQTLADDLCAVQRIYAEFFATLDETSWDKPVKRSGKEWIQHEMIAHLCALNGAGLEIQIHAGLFHAAQVAEPSGHPPLWMQLPADIRHRVVGRVMRAFSLLYRCDIGGSLRTSIVFRVAGRLHARHG